VSTPLGEVPIGGPIVPFLLLTDLRIVAAGLQGTDKQEHYLTDD